MDAVLNRNAVLKYLGYRSGGVPEDVEAMIDRATGAVLALEAPRGLWKAFAYHEGRLDGTNLTLKGKDLLGAMEGAHDMILLVQSLGQGVDRAIRKAHLTDMAYSVVLDACASARIEKLTDDLQKEAQKAFPGAYFTERYAPGYGDFPLEQNAEILQVLDATRRAGVSLSSGGLMIPIKSICGIVGVCDAPQARWRLPCESCPAFQNCAFRARGEVCYT